jgi:uncharacterized membrane protein YbaN (DUF454 family)
VITEGTLMAASVMDFIDKSDVDPQSRVEGQIKYTVKHAIPGRLRLSFPLLDAPRPWLAWLATDLGTKAGVRHVATNTLCQSLTVFYDPEAITPAQLRGYIGAIDADELAGLLAEMAATEQGLAWNDSYWHPWNLAGSVFMALGVVGIFLPLVPTVPFLLAALWCYLKSSGRFYDWLMNQPTLGKYLREYQEGKGFSAEVKRQALIFSWLGAGISIIFVSSLLINVVVLAGTIWGTIYIIDSKTLAEEA